MRSRVSFFRDGGEDNIKKWLNAWIEKQGLTEEEAFKVLESVSNQHRNIYLIRENAQKAEFKLTRFISSDALELYFDILKKGKNIGYISKGWDDPGFRVGEYFDMDKKDPAFKKKFYEIFRICSSNLVSLSISEKTPGKIGISLEIAIYRDGFNEKVLKEAVGTLESTMCKIKHICEDK